MQDIVPELREAVENSFTESVKKNEKIQKILERVQAGKATYEDADEYAAEIGEALANAFREHISSDILPDGKMYYNIASRLVPGPCRLAQAAINNVTRQIQRDMNEKAGLSIKPQIPRYNEDREKGLIEYMCGADRYDDVSKSATADIVNFIQSMVTDAVKANAEFQWRAGLSPVIRRTANGGCCAWCAKLAGVYPYEDVRATGSDVYRRHRDCRCKVTFDPGDGKVQNVHTKNWENRSAVAKEMARRENANTRRRRGERGEVIDKATFNKLTKGFRRRGGIIRMDEEAEEHLRKLNSSAAYLPSLDTALFYREPTVSEVLEEMYHDLQHRKKMFYDLPFEEADLRREIDAQKHLLSVTKRYKIPLEQVEETRENLRYYEELLDQLIRKRRQK